MITNTKNDKVKFIKKLQQKARFRKEQGLFVCEGLRLVQEVPKEMLEVVFVEESFGEVEANRKWTDWIRSEGIRVEVVTQDVMMAMTKVEKPQGILAAAKSPKWDIKSIYDAQNALIVVLSALRDPGNLGTILRTAEAAGVTGIIASNDTVDVFSPKVVRSTMGGIFRMPYVVTDDLSENLNAMSEKGICTIASVLSDDSVDYDTLDLKKPCAIIIGNEANGIETQIIEQAAVRAHIPMVGECESINASVACGVMIMEAARQRRHADMV